MFQVRVVAALITFILGNACEEVCENGVVEGDYEIGGQSDLDALEGCREIEGSLNIKGTELESLHGLESLEAVGEDLLLKGNGNLKNLEGLNGLREVGGGLIICSMFEGLDLLEDRRSPKNGNFASCPERIPDTVKTVRWSVSLSSSQGNRQLESLDGLESLSSVESLRIDSNESLKDISGLKNLKTVRREMVISSNDSLGNMRGLDNIRSAGSVEIGGNESLKDLDGLGRLEAVEWDLSINANRSLRNIDGLEKLTDLGGNLSIYGNKVLPACEAEELVDRLEQERWRGDAYISGNDDEATCE